MRLLANVNRMLETTGDPHCFKHILACALLTVAGLVHGAGDLAQIESDLNRVEALVNAEKYSEALPHLEKLGADGRQRTERFRYLRTLALYKSGHTEEALASAVEYFGIHFYQGIYHAHMNDVAAALGISTMFRHRADYFCVKFGQISRNQVAGFLTDELEKSPVSIDDFFRKPGCQPAGYGPGIKSPLIHLAIDLPISRQGFSEVIYKYHTIRRKDHEAWLQAINATNTMGETFLDYIETRIAGGAYPSPETIEAAMAIRKFICERGGKYKRFGDKRCE